MDVTDKSNIELISRISYPDTGYTHQGWLTEDKSYFIFDDEGDELDGFAPKTRTHVLDVRSLTNVTYLGFHEGRTSAIDHNLYIKNDLVYQANCRAGLNILRHEGDQIFEEAGYFDIFPSSDSKKFNGAWSTYPFHSSGIVTVSGIEQGLFILKDNLSPSFPTTSPVNPPSLTPAPVGVPTNYPSENPSVALIVSTPTPTTPNVPTSTCVDSTLRLKIVKDGAKITRSCGWVSNRDTANRCKLPGVAAACPVTCGACNSCVDPVPGANAGLRFRFLKDGRYINRDCSWVARKDKTNRCKLISNTCRATCGVC